MNKYVVRTSLVWLGLAAVLSGVYFYHSRQAQRPVPAPEGVQPAAIGSAAPQASSGQMTESSSSEAPLAPVQLTPERMQSIGVQTGTVEWKQLSNQIRATGTVDINERLVSYVQVRFSGYVRRVFANATYQHVSKGDPLFTIYSPELVAAQNDYLLALGNQQLLGKSSVDGVAAAATAVTAASEARLQQWDIGPAVIEKIRETGKPNSELVIRSPVSGYITERNALPDLYVEPATRLYAIADLSQVWIYAQIFQNDVGSLRPGDAAQITVDSYPGLMFHARIESILPQVDLATRTVRVRLAIPNPGLRLKPGMFVNVDLKTNLGRQLVVPSSAVLQTGLRQLVFVDRGGGKLEPVDVVIGSRIDDQTIILKGLSAHQHVVTSANFLIDSESQLQAAAGSFTPPPPGASAAAAQPAQRARVKIDFTTDPAPPRKGKNTFRIKLTGANQVPLDGADVSVAFFMPAMPAMGMAAMNTKVQLGSLGNGVYQGAGVLQSGGLWQTTITVQKGGQILAAKQLRVNATGGM